VFYRSRIDHKNGYEWLSFHGVTFGGLPCGFSLCFLHDALTEVHIGVSLPNAELEGGWPTRRAIEEEVVFIRAELGKQLSRSFQTSQERFAWGVVWAMVDSKAFVASAGLRYET
jgi:hypothetical protein